MAYVEAQAGLRPCPSRTARSSRWWSYAKRRSTPHRCAMVAASTSRRVGGSGACVSRIDDGVDGVVPWEFDDSPGKLLDRHGRQLALTLGSICAKLGVHRRRLRLPAIHGHPGGQGRTRAAGRRALQGSVDTCGHGRVCLSALDQLNVPRRPTPPKSPRPDARSTRRPCDGGNVSLAGIGYASSRW